MEVFVLTYITSPVSIVGAAFCSINVFIFSRPVFRQKLYRFLKYESIFITCDLLIKAFSPVAYCQHCSISKTFSSCVYVIYFSIYLSSILEMSAFMCNIFSGLYFYFLVKNIKLSFQINHRVTILVFVVLSSCVFSYQLLEFEIKYKVDNVTQEIAYHVKLTDFYYSQVCAIVEIVVNSFRDGLHLGILITINVMLIVHIKASMRHKMTILPKPDSRSKNTLFFIDRQRSTTDTIKIKERRITNLIVINCSNSIFGRLPILVYFILRNLSNDTLLVDYFGGFAFFFVYTSYLAKFFLFYLINRNFRDSVNQIFFRRF